jgi:hypothetical protein
MLPALQLAGDVQVHYGFLRQFRSVAINPDSGVYVPELIVTCSYIPVLLDPVISLGP